MATAIDNDWLDARIAKVKTQITNVEDAIDALDTGAQSYTIDTGQTKQTVTKAQLGSLRRTLEYLENKLATLDARRNGGGARVLPGW